MWLREGLLSAVLTLKLNNWSFAARADSFLPQTREMGLVEPRARQLVSHRQESCIAGGRGVRAAPLSMAEVTRVLHACVC